MDKTVSLSYLEGFRLRTSRSHIGESPYRWPSRDCGYEQRYSVGNAAAVQTFAQLVGFASQLHPSSFDFITLTRHFGQIADGLVAFLPEGLTEHFDTFTLHHALVALDEGKLPSFRGNLCFPLRFQHLLPELLHLPVCIFDQRVGFFPVSSYKYSTKLSQASATLAKSSTRSYSQVAHVMDELA